MIRSVIRPVGVLVLGVFLAVKGVWADGPARWVVADEDTTITLMGSVHVLKPGTDWVSDDIRALVAQADRLYLELSPDQSNPQVMGPLVGRYGYLPAGDSLEATLPPADYLQLQAALKELGVPEAGYQRMKPWFATVIYGSAKFAQLGYNPAAGVEAVMTAMAQEQNIEVKGLETAEKQLRIFDQMTAETELAFLRSALADQDDLAAVMERLTSSWLAGDMGDLGAYFDESFRPFPALRKRILQDRNQIWGRQIQALLDLPGRFLIVVGAGHLAGGDSVQHVLRAAGLTVQRLD